MRTIKFRGFGAGKWRYGYYVHFDERPLLSVIYNPKFRDFIISQDKYGEHAIPVDPETVGQFTGLYDKNGKEIYEGDIVSIEAIKSRINKVVEWNSERACWDAGGENRIDLYAFCYCEVIGNIYDNKELLTQN